MKSSFISAVLTAASLIHASTIPAKRVIESSGWQSVGCFSDNQLSRTLSVFGQANDQVSVTQCQQLCASKGFAYAGLEYGGQCYCDSAINPVAYLEPDSQCNMPCSGDNSQICGAADRINVYSTAPQTPVDNSVGFSYEGCWSDYIAARTLSTRVDTAGGKDALTVKACLVACKNAGFSLAGVEYSAECYCDNYIQNNQTQIDESKCDMQCNGDRSLTCGGKAAMNLYSIGGIAPKNATVTSSLPVLPANWAAQGCYTDSVNARALTGNYILAPNSGLTVEYCINYCISQNYTVAGVEYGGECYCDNQIENGQTLASDSSTCNMQCSGNSGQKCGGPDRINIYSYSPPGPTIPGPDHALDYAGCTNAFYFNYGYQTQPNTLDAQSCQAYCQNSGASQFGLWQGYYCLCGQNAGFIVSDSLCDAPCPGDAKQSCGGLENNVVVLYNL